MEREGRGPGMHFYPPLTEHPTAEALRHSLLPTTYRGTNAYHPVLSGAPAGDTRRNRIRVGLALGVVLMMGVTFTLWWILKPQMYRHGVA